MLSRFSKGLLNMCTSCEPLTAFVLDCFLKNVYIVNKQPWKTELVSYSRTKAGMLTDQY